MIRRQSINHTEVAHIRIVMYVLLTVGVLMGVVVLGFAAYQTKFVNPRITEELRKNPMGATAQRVMLLTFPDGTRTIPVNYLQEGSNVYAGADGPWWRSFQDGGARVKVLIRGQELGGHATAVPDDNSLTRDIFSRLRPNVPKWLPDQLNGILVVVKLDPNDGG